MYIIIRFDINNGKLHYSVGTYMELNMPIRAVKVKPIANMDFILT